MKKAKGSEFVIKKSKWKTLKENRELLGLTIPGTIWFLIFAYLPMVGVVIAFKNWRIQGGFIESLFNSEWVGLANFKFLFQSSDAWLITKNTVLYNITFIILGIVIPVSLAILLRELFNKRLSKFYQTAMFLPYFISWVVVGMIAYNFLNVEYGTINALIAKLGGEKINFYGTTWVWPIILVFFSAWKNVGYGTILYLAAIMGIDTEIYEAAEIDGANIFQRIFRVTIPCLVPTLIILTLLAVGNIFRGDFQMFYQLVGNNGPLFNTTDVIDTFTFRSLIQSGEVGMSAAAGLYQSVFCFITIVFTNFLVKRYDPDYSLF